MKRTVRMPGMLLIGALCMGGSASAFGGVIFSDNFSDGDVSDWTKTTNYGGTTAVTVRSDSFVSPGFAMYTYLDAPPGGVSLFVHASHDFTTSAAVDHTLSLWARSSPCQGCTISYDVIVDGTSLDRKFFPDAFESRQFTLSGLTPGVHTLTLGIFTTNASNGNFSASFDDVQITAPDDPNAVPEPSTFVLLAAGLGMFAIRHKSRLSTR